MGYVISNVSETLLDELRALPVSDTSVLYADLPGSICYSCVFRNMTTNEAVKYVVYAYSTADAEKLLLSSFSCTLINTFICTPMLIHAAVTYCGAACDCYIFI